MTFIEVIDSLIKPEDCEKIIHKFLKDGGRVDGSTVKGFESQIVRNLTELRVLNRKGWEEEERLLSNIFTEAFNYYYEKYPSLKFITKHPRVYNTGYFIKHYEKEKKGSYSEHIDFQDFRDQILTGILYLNDVIEGGETEFPIQKTKVFPKKGSICLFPSSWTHPHKVNPTVSNDRFIVNTFFKIERTPEQNPLNFRKRSLE